MPAKSHLANLTPITVSDALSSLNSINVNDKKLKKLKAFLLTMKEFDLSWRVIFNKKTNGDIRKMQFSVINIYRKNNDILFVVKEPTNGIRSFYLSTVKAFAFW